MNEIFDNPFDLMSLAAGPDLFGREEELGWLMKGIQQQAQLLLFGAQGMGKSSLLEKAGATLAQGRGGWMIRLDLSLHRNVEETVGVLRKATDQLQRSPEHVPQPGVLGDRGRKAAGRSNAAGELSSGVCPDNPFVNLLRTLGDLNAFALQQKRSLVVAFDSCEEMGRLGGEHFENTVMTAVETHSAMSHILCGEEHRLHSGSSNGMRALQGAFEAQRLGPLEPHAFAHWIDERFRSANIITRGVGAACVDLAGPNIAQTVELAQRAFELSFRARFANEATVQTGLNQIVAGKQEQFAAAWKGLSAPEQSVLLTVAKEGGQGLLQAEAFSRCGLQTDEQARSAIHGLVEKRYLDLSGSMSVRMPSAAMKRWTLQAQMSFGRQQKSSAVSTHQLAFRLNFHSAINSGKGRTLGY